MSINEKAGLALIIGCTALLAIMGLHPDGRDILTSAANGETNVLNILVHGMSILTMPLLVSGTLALTLRLDGDRALATVAFAMFALGAICFTISGTSSGFLAPAVAAGIGDAQGAARDAIMAAFRFSGLITLSFAKVGYSLIALAIIAWSAAMMRGGVARFLALYGLVVGALSIIGIALGFLRLRLYGFGGLVLLGEAVWLIWAGAFLRREKKHTAP
jgi:hypothetical protein